MSFTSVLPLKSITLTCSRVYSLFLICEKVVRFYFKHLVLDMEVEANWSTRFVSVELDFVCITLNTAHHNKLISNKYISVLGIMQNMTATPQGLYQCDTCTRTYRWQSSYITHKKFECGKEPRFSCHFCDYKAKRKVSLHLHLAKKHSQ